MEHLKNNKKQRMKKIVYILTAGMFLTFASCQTPPYNGETQTDSTTTQSDSDSVVVVKTDSVTMDSTSVDSTVTDSSSVK